MLEKGKEKKHRRHSGIGASCAWQVRKGPRRLPDNPVDSVILQKEARKEVEGQNVPETLATKHRRSAKVRLPSFECSLPIMRHTVRTRVEFCPPPSMRPPRNAVLPCRGRFCQISKKQCCVSMELSYVCAHQNSTAPMLFASRRTERPRREGDDQESERV